MDGLLQIGSNYSGSINWVQWFREVGADFLGWNAGCIVMRFGLSWPFFLLCFFYPSLGFFMIFHNGILNIQFISGHDCGLCHFKFSESSDVDH